MTSFTVSDYKKKRKTPTITFHCEVNDRVEVLFMPGPKSFFGTVSEVHTNRCFVEFDDGTNHWINRYGEQADCIRKTTAPPDFRPPMEEPEDLSDYNMFVVYRFEPGYSDTDD